jgi:hypothetical protein
VNLIEDDELLGVVGEVERRLSEASAVRCGLQVQVDRGPCLGDLQGECGLAGLPRAEKGDGWHLVKQCGDFRGHSSLDHSCNRKPSLEICADYSELGG